MEAVFYVKLATCGYFLYAVEVKDGHVQTQLQSMAQNNPICGIRRTAPCGGIIVLS